MAPYPRSSGGFSEPRRSVLGRCCEPEEASLEVALPPCLGWEALRRWALPVEPVLPAEPVRGALPVDPALPEEPVRGALPVVPEVGVVEVRDASPVVVPRCCAPACPPWDAGRA